jgi:hypothetical protein
LPQTCRYNYVTPTSYLELLTTFLKLLGEKRTEVSEAKKRLVGGLDKLTNTAAQVRLDADTSNPRLGRCNRSAVHRMMMHSDIQWVAAGGGGGLKCW